MRHVLIFPVSLLELALIAIGACSDRNAGQATTQAPTVDSSRDTAAPAEPLSPERAFPLKVDSRDEETLLAVFMPAPDHYLYKSKISFALKDATGVQLATVVLPPGIPKKDPFLGEQDIYRQPIQISLPLARPAGAPAKFTLIASYQGCNEKIGLCYSPIETTFDFALPSTTRGRR